MRVVASQKKSFIEQLAFTILTRLEKNRSFSEVEYLKCKLGLETLLIDASKLIVIYGLAIIIGVTWETLIIHLGYMAIRTFAHGVHSESSFSCTLISCVILIGTPMVLSTIQFPQLALPAIAVINLMILIIYAPAATRKNGIWRLKSTKRKKLQNKAIIANIVLSLVSMILLPRPIGMLLLTGSFIASLMTTPPAYHLLKSERIENNGEFYY